MILLVCTDDAGGMLFNRRRQSQDRILREKILSLTAGGVLWMNEYSYGQFRDGTAEGIRVDGAFLQKAGSGEYCFVEDQRIDLADGRIEAVIRYCWNRAYPADLYLDLEQLAARFRLVSREEFAGSSHEKITKERYVR
ncbi:MAG TPA: ribonuclease Z [Candidatus Eisenbergiella merdigallinarum]|uniref:Ribonuclease Z n=1 Tax=Candidatus Eisenbergiella merdigallinarum TaxID=2838552 RepID=A0A9D2MPQ0_9FIRM|nr:ribonuclease Z [Candidatus Eisenbergiella merdigallinarum]